MTHSAVIDTSFFTFKESREKILWPWVVHMDQRIVFLDSSHTEDQAVENRGRAKLKSFLPLVEQVLFFLQTR